MTSQLTVGLAWSDSEQAGKFTKLRTERSLPTPGPIDNVGSLLVMIREERED